MLPDQGQFSAEVHVQRHEAAGTHVYLGMSVAPSGQLTTATWQSI